MTRITIYISCYFVKWLKCKALFVKCTCGPELSALRGLSLEHLNFSCRVHHKYLKHVPTTSEAVHKLLWSSTAGALVFCTCLWWLTCLWRGSGVSWQKSVNVLFVWSCFSDTIFFFKVCRVSIAFCECWGLYLWVPKMLIHWLLRHWRVCWMPALLLFFFFLSLFSLHVVSAKAEIAFLLLS